MFPMTDDESLPPGPRREDRPVGFAGEEAVVDLRFRALVGEEGWSRLPDAVRRRFSKRLAPGSVLLYSGEVLETKLTRAGRCLAFLARAIGAPLIFSAAPSLSAAPDWMGRSAMYVRRTDETLATSPTR